MIRTTSKPRDEKLVILPKDIIDILGNENDRASLDLANWRENIPGIYECAVCRLPVFDSWHLIESDADQPSFWQPIHPTCISLQSDETLGMALTLVECTRCGAHLGYVFDDGPAPTGLRYALTRAAWILI